MTDVRLIDEPLKYLGPEFIGSVRRLVSGRLRAERLRRGIGLREAARAIGADPSNLSKFERSIVWSSTYATALRDYLFLTNPPSEDAARNEGETLERESLLHTIDSIVQDIAELPISERSLLIDDAQGALREAAAVLRAAPSGPTREQVEALRKPPEPGIVYGVASPSYNEAIDDVLSLYLVPALRTASTNQESTA